MLATGTFSTSLQPITAYAPDGEGTKQGRMSIDKEFFGELIGISVGEMLTAMTPVQGSAGYVAIEKVTGELNGKKGSFALQHFGIMRSKESRLILEVVPDSGTDELTGLSGSMEIRREDGEHFYDFDFSL
jgi:hypothetical protein